MLIQTQEAIGLGNDQMGSPVDQSEAGGTHEYLLRFRVVKVILNLELSA